VGWEGKLLDSARGVHSVSDEAEEVGDGQNDEDDVEDGEDKEEDWNIDDGSGSIVMIGAGVEEMQRLGEVRLRLPRDGTESRSLVWTVLNGGGIW